MRRRRAPLCLAALLSCLIASSCRTRSHDAAPRVPDPTATRVISSGKLVGFASSEKTQAWVGIPFAAPPTGDLRWRPPRAPLPWGGVRESLRAGPVCPQLAGLLSGAPDAKPGSVVGSEDCLFLNVFAPRASAEEAAKRRLPVMLWIHGGGNTIGRADAYDGSALAAAYDVVVVTTNYRLGAFGWFRHPALVADAASDDERSGNWGTLDLIRALEWVRDDIGAFGGDPKNVTIFGESAGGTNVFSLLVSKRAEGLFQRAISESGGLSSVSLADAENLKDAAEPGDERSSAEIALRVAFPGASRAEALARWESLSDAQIAAKLRAASAEQIIGACAEGQGNGMSGMLRMPLVLRDGAVLPLDEEATLLADGRYQHVPVILGSNRDELKLFLFGDRELVRRWFGFLPRVRDPNRYEVTAEYGTLSWKMRGVDDPAASMRAAQGPNVYAYRFDWDEEPSLLWSDFSKLLGAAHGMEIPFVFKNFQMNVFDRMFTEGNRAGREPLANAMSSYWAQFAYSGSPGRGRAGDLPEWKAWSAADGGDKFIVFDTTAGGGLRMEAQPVTKQLLLAKLATDPRMDEALRCDTFNGLVEHDALASTDAAAAGCSAPSHEDTAAR
jgi:para-nitrobenzyl esterase